MGNVVKNFLLLSEKKWHDLLFANLQMKVEGNWFRCSERNDFNTSLLNEIKPDFIFIPHWSHIIPSEIYTKYQCVVFHMTDLPYGRGGSPLQNLIVRGHTETKISAIKVTEGIDTGPVYLKKKLDLAGSARDIFDRASKVIYEMILEILERKITPQPQQGEVVVFKRRKPEDSNIDELNSAKQVYDYIRMLDADGYPNAFMETANLRFEFTSAQINNDNTVTAHVRIIQK